MRWRSSCGALFGDGADGTRLLALTGASSHGSAAQLAVLVAKLVTLVVAVAELREVQQHAAQATAARAGAMRLREHCAQPASASAWYSRARAAHVAGPSPIPAQAPVAPAVSPGQAPAYARCVINQPGDQRCDRCPVMDGRAHRT